MTSYVKRVGDLTDPENFEKAVAEANKNGIEDLKKARECIDNMIRAIEGDGDE